MSTTGSSHLLGTARMGDDPRTSVVDRWNMSHDVPNLGVIDGSVFVTAGAVNPTSTICALALRAVEHLMAHSVAVRPPERARPVAFLFGSVLGVGCLLGAGVLDALGVAWSRRIAHRAARLG